jgi:hypothetical protein
MRRISTLSIVTNSAAVAGRKRSLTRPMRWAYRSNCVPSAARFGAQHRTSIFA